MSSGTYRDVLREVLASRRSRNRAYTQAAFARDLGISSSLLCEVLAGQHGLSRAKAEAMTRRLGMSAGERERFCDLVEAEHARSPKRRAAVARRVQARRADADVERLSADVFAAISEWHHFAILELMTLPGVAGEAEWIAAQLGISTIEAETALERMERLGMIERGGGTGGSLRTVVRRTLTTSEVPSAAIRRLHAGLLEKAQRALHEQRMEQRYVSSAVLAIDKSRLGEAMRRLDEFRREFCNEIDGNGGKDAVYCLTTQFFALQQGG